MAATQRRAADCEQPLRDQPIVACRRRPRPLVATPTTCATSGPKRPTAAAACASPMRIPSPVERVDVPAGVSHEAHAARRARPCALQHRARPQRRAQASAPSSRDRSSGKASRPASKSRCGGPSSATPTTPAPLASRRPLRAVPSEPQPCRSRAPDQSDAGCRNGGDEPGRAGPLESGRTADRRVQPIARHEPLARARPPR